MSKFVDKTPIAVPEWDDDGTIISDRPPDVIWIRPKMNVMIRGLVTSEMFGMSKGMDLEARLGANETALLIHNIVRWEGPSFEGRPCTRANIEELDPTDPHLSLIH